MSAEVQEIQDFIVAACDAMHFSVPGATSQTPLGDGGFELESLAVAQLTLAIGDRYGLRLDEEQRVSVLGLTLGEFAQRLAQVISARRGDGSAT